MERVTHSGVGITRFHKVECLSQVGKGAIQVAAGVSANGISRALNIYGDVRDGLVNRTSLE